MTIGRCEKRGISLILVLALCMLMIAGLAGCGSEKNSKAIEITVWNSYNGSQLEVFNDLVNEFNKTYGAEKNITVESVGCGSIDEVADRITEAAQTSQAETDLPDLFTTYEDTVYDLYQKGYAADISVYFDDTELGKYVDCFIDEGDVLGNGSLLMFPIAKSTELLYLDKTDWDVFSEATGADIESLSTVEGMLETAEKYYEWTDAKTPDIPNDGKAFMSRDSMSNYILAGFEQLGHTLFNVDENGSMTLDFDRDTAKSLWYQYSVPFMKGIYGGESTYGSDNVRTSDVIAYIGSSAGATYFPEEVSDSEGVTHEIEMLAMKAPIFRNGKDITIQQGVGLAMVDKKDEAKKYAAAEFLKWFTDSEQNIRFSAQSGYMPVKKDSFNIEAVKAVTEANGIEVEENVLSVLDIAMKMVSDDNEPFIRIAFSDASNAQVIIHGDLAGLLSENRSQIKARINAGESPEAAQADYISEEYFNSWYEATLEALMAYEG